MSTRSGKRIHGSFHEDPVKAEDVKSERKTRSKRQKENDTEFNITLPKSKKRNNYVSYPTDDEFTNETTVADTTEDRDTRQLRRNTLKEHNASETTNNVVNKKNRLTRRTKQISDSVDSVENNNVEVPNGKQKGKRNKKRKSKSIEPEIETVEEAKTIKTKKRSKTTEAENEKPKSIELEIEEDEINTVKTKKRTSKTIEIENRTDNEVERANKPAKKKKKKGKRSSSIIVEDIKPEAVKNVLNKSNVSSDSFHSAAGSPMTEDCNDLVNGAIENSPKQVNNDHLNKISEKTDDKDTVATILNNTFDKESLKRKSSVINTTFDKINNISTSSTSLNKVLNSTYDKDVRTSDNLNTTFDILFEIRKSRSSISRSNVAGNLNSTFDKNPQVDSKTVSLDSTYDKETENKIDTTFDKTQNKSNSKSSLISSDGAVNVTYDKSIENSRISITSDDSKTENIVNTTPVLIESSLDESHILETSIGTKKPFIESNISINGFTKDLPPQTPLKREGTFTKDGPDAIIMSPKPKLSLEKTPTKRMSLPSPGCTPFHVTRSSQKEKSILNITHSIEKAARRSSLAEVVPRQTRVMFCSPVNNPALVMQQNRKVIKSSMKGSNKSFVFDESVTLPAARQSGRKRSYTHGDAADSRAKRSRLGDDLQQSVDRLARPRTASATAKLPETTPLKKPATPSKRSEAKPSRTKLPNFAALHQRRFERMESLDECQQRKARRARQLLTPTGGVAVLERSSPRGSITEPQKPPNSTAPVTNETATVAKETVSASKETVTASKKTARTPRETVTASKETVTASKETARTRKETVTASKETVTASKDTATSSKKTASKPTITPKPDIPTLESLRPGYTRFGFKMNIGFNPFSVPSKHETRPKEIKPNGLKRQATQPSLTGSTVRKEAARQTVMREKSFTSLSSKRSAIRTENRTIIKGVRTNRRFELQMKMRDI